MKKIIPFFLVNLLLSFAARSQEQEEARKTIAGAKMYFSDQPFAASNAGSKNSFTSSDFIYGRLELDNKTLGEAFGLPKDGESNMSNGSDCSLYFEVTVFKDDEQRGRENMWPFLYVWGKEKTNTTLNFDILPEPAKAKSMNSGTENSTSSGLASGQLYELITKERFPENGAYTVRVKLYQQSLDDWGVLAAADKWPMIEEDFTFNFDGKDIKKLMANGAAAGELVKENAYRLDKMPDWFYKAGKFNDPKATNAAIAAILKRDIPTKSILKFVTSESIGPLWVVEKDNYGAIMRRTFMPTINIAYKRDGKCYVGTVRFWEPYEGYGKYGTLIVGSESSSRRSDYWLDCSLVK